MLAGHGVSTGRAVRTTGILPCVLGLVQNTSNVGRSSSFDKRRAVSTSTGDTGQLKTEYDAVVIGAGLVTVTDSQQGFRVDQMSLR